MFHTDQVWSSSRCECYLWIHLTAVCSDLVKSTVRHFELFCSRGLFLNLMWSGTAPPDMHTGLWERSHLFTKAHTEQNINHDDPASGWPLTSRLRIQRRQWGCVIRTQRWLTFVFHSKRGFEVLARNWKPLFCLFFFSPSSRGPCSCPVSL